MARDVAAEAREAYATGWALSGGPMTESVRAGCAAAAEIACEHAHDPGVLELALDLGKLTGTWAEVYRRREELAAGHVAKITKAWRTLVRRLDIRDLITAYRRDLIMGEADDGKPGKRQRKVAAAAVLAWLQGILSDPGYRDLAGVIAGAIVAAQAEGRTAALAVAADRAGALGFDWDKAYQAMLAIVEGSGPSGLAARVEQQVLAAAASDIGRAVATAASSGASDTEIAQAAEDAIAGAGDAGAGLAADTGMSAGFGQGSIDLAASEGILLDWLSAGDGRVCPSCQDNEDNGPYAPSAFPSCPDHPRCRCTPTPAEPMRFSAFADFLIPP